MGNAEFQYDFGPLNFTPEQVEAVNQQAADDVQAFLQTPEYKQEIIEKPPTYNDPITVIDPNWNPDVLREVVADLGQAYDPNHEIPTYADVNTVLKGTVYYQDTARDKLQGKYWPIQSLDEETAQSPNNYFIFNYYGQIFWAWNSEAWIFTGLGYSMQKAKNSQWYMIDPNQEAQNIFPGIVFGDFNTLPIYSPPDFSNNDNPLDNVPFVDIPPPNKIAPPLQEEKNSQTLLYLSLGLIGLYLLRKSAKN